LRLGCSIQKNAGSVGPTPIVGIFSSFIFFYFLLFCQPYVPQQCTQSSVMGRKPAFVFSMNGLRALSSLRGLRGAPGVPPLCRETQSLGQQMFTYIYLYIKITFLRTSKKRHASPLNEKIFKFKPQTQHHGGFLKPLGPSLHYRIEGFKRGPFIGPPLRQWTKFCPVRVYWTYSSHQSSELKIQELSVSL